MTLLRGIIADIWIYVVTWSCVLLSSYLPLLMSILEDDPNQRIPAPTVWQIIAAFLMGGLVLVILEANGDPLGKKKNLKRRAAWAALLGLGWKQVIAGMVPLVEGLLKLLRLSAGL